MALSDFLKELDELAESATKAFQSATADALETIRVEFLGAKSGRLKTVQKQMGAVEKEDRPAAGKRLNEVKQLITDAFERVKSEFESRPPEDAGNERFDPTLPGHRLQVGHLHPITQTMEELKEIMGRLGFATADGPEIEDERHNFEALNIPLAHPARDPLDNFYLSTARQTAGPAAAGGTGAAGPETLLLRSQTSTVQIRVMERSGPPVRIVSLGRVYRPDTADPTHYPMFHQIEGLWVDRRVTLADLKTVLRLFASSYLGSDVHIRFRPSFFPFTEPSVEVDMSWQGGWMEMGGAGMVDPNVLRAVGYDPDEVTGFAFGLGVERMCMRRHGINDIREFYRNDVRFLQQF